MNDVKNTFFNTKKADPFIEKVSFENLEEDVITKNSLLMSLF